VYEALSSERLMASDVERFSLLNADINFTWLTWPLLRHWRHKARFAFPAKSHTYALLNFRSRTACCLDYFGLGQECGGLREVHQIVDRASTQNWR
jgi:hypothetical protein